ncbi:uncharacterized protein LTR77_002392 [Saxophila tyrrhenica]|uniref:NAD(P)-binding domain-containing protein n=1 Tax=Saxophila tyrrhenica TaxID=1690608 RepID=A0AAV9PN33_9PEZI|nr:hypothetical protein LTR77_002392 [Saxophila tyrrhenica]
MTTTPKPLSFFGATGDSTAHCLAHSLRCSHPCVALARTPTKLTTSLRAKNVSDAQLDQYLTIIPGDVRDLDAVKRTLLTADGKGVAEMVVVGVGSYPTWQWSVTEPIVQTDPKICQDAGARILQALEELKPVRKPLLVNVSTTGIPPQGKPWDVPRLFSWLYRVLLHNAHADKIVLQERLGEYMRRPEAERGIRGFVNVKASLLMDGEALGVEKVREGMEDEPAVGYTIRRADVGGWMFGRLVKGRVREEWVDRGVCITY